MTNADLAAHIVEELKVIDKAADTSANLKGTYVRYLRIAVRRVEAASIELHKRTDVARPECSDECSQQRQEILALREEQ